MENIRIIIASIPKLLTVVPISLAILAVSVAIGSVIGLGLTLVRLGNHPFPKLLASIYISFMRGTPLLIQLFLAFFGIPAVLKQFGVTTSGWQNEIFAVIAFSLNLGAFLSEIFRSAYLSVDRGQIEAAHSIGMNDQQTLVRVIFPQALLVALPNMSNMIIDLLKNTSLAFSIGVVDIMGKGSQLAAAAFGVGQLGIFLSVALLYIIICTIMEKGFHLLERSLSKGLNPISEAGSPATAA